MPRNPNCERCPLHLGVNHVCLWGEGTRRSGIMLVGEAPGENEDREGHPFIGAAGKHLDNCLGRAGLSREDVFIANAVKCRPPGNRDPTKEELGQCFPYLAEEIERIKPKVIIAVGRWSLKILTGQEAIGRSRGKLLDPLPKVRVGDAKIIATYHPAAYLHSGNKAILDSIVEDLKGALNLVSPVDDVASDSRTLLPEGYSSKQFIAALKGLAPTTELACDLEWLALRRKEIAWPWTPGVSQLSMSLTGRVNGALKSVAFAWPPKPQGLKALHSFLSKRGLIFHNAMADVIWMLSAGLRPRVAGDSMLLSYLLDEQRRAGLKGIAPLVAGVKPGWEEKPWYKRPASRKGWLDLLIYNAGDTESTLLTHEAEVAQLRAMPGDRYKNTWRVYTRLLLPAVVTFARIALAGTPIDMVAIRSEIKKHRALYDAAVDRFAATSGLRRDVAEKLANSPAQVKRYLQDAFALDIDSTREDALIDYVDQYPTIADIQSVRHEGKMLHTYLEPWERLLLAQGDRRLHSVYLLGVTRTGRLSAEVEEGGSLLLTPRDGWMRDLIAAEPGFEIISADYSQLELRVIAWLAPERTMRRLFAEGADLHATTAAFVKSGLPQAIFWKRRKRLAALVSKDERQAGKSNNFGFVFGMREDKYTHYAKNNYGITLTIEEAGVHRDGFFNLYSDLNAWHERAIREAADKGYTLTPFGRYRFDVPDATQAINTPIQSTGSDLTMLAMTVVDERLQALAAKLEAEFKPEDMQLVGFIHDAILVHARKPLIKQIKRIISAAMDNPALERVGIKEIPVPLVADVKAGPTWAKAS